MGSAAIAFFTGGASLTAQAAMAGSMKVSNYGKAQVINAGHIGANSLLFQASDSDLVKQYTAIPLPPGWTEKTDPQSGQKYYEHTDGRKLLERPKATRRLLDETAK